MKYEEATEALREFWEQWEAAKTNMIDFHQAYLNRARLKEIRLCQHCEKPMPDGDTSMNCDGCHLPWGWDTEKGRRERRADELDREIERLQKQRAKL